MANYLTMPYNEKIRTLFSWFPYARNQFGGFYFYFTLHGQCEGDSVHSTISTALGNAGDLFVPLQLTPIIALILRKQNYRVQTLKYSDFLDSILRDESLRRTVQVYFCETPTYKHDSMSFWEAEQ